MLATLITLLAGYFALLLVTTIWATGNSMRTVEDFFLSGRSLGVVALTGTIVATAINGLAVTGTPALFYQGGILFLQMFVVLGVVTGLIWKFGPGIATFGQRNGIITQGEYFGAFYDSRLIKAIVAFLGLMSMLPFLAAQIVGIGKIMSGITSGAISFEVAIGLCVTAIAVYVFVGGARAVVLTDIFQGLIAIAFLLMSAVLFSRWVGGIGQSVRDVAEYMPENLTFNAENTPVFVDHILSWSFAFFLWPQAFQRLFMAKDPGGLRRVAALGLATNAIILTCVLIMAVAATAHFQGTLDDPETLVAAMFHHFWPIGGVILVLVIFALAMSTIDSMVLTAGSIITRDVVGGVFRVRLSEPVEMALSRWATVAFIAIAVLIAVTSIGQNAIVPWVALSASIATLLLWPLVGTVWQRSTRVSVIAAMTIGFLAICITFLGDNRVLAPFGPATVGFVTGGLVFAVISLTARRQDRQQQAGRT